MKWGFNRKRPRKRSIGAKRKSSTQLPRQIRRTTPVEPRRSPFKSGSKHRRKAESGRGARSALLVILSLMLTVWVIFFGSFDTTPEVSGSIDHGRIEAASIEYFSQVTNSRFGFNADSYESFIRRSLPDLMSVETSVNFLSRTVKVSAEAYPAAIVLQSAGRRYPVSHTGVVVSTDQEDTSLPIVVDPSGLQYQPGDRVLSGEFVAFVVILGQQRQRGLVINSLEIENTERSLAASVKEKPYKILLSTSLDPKAQLNSVGDLLNRLSREGRPTPSSYIDTRTPGRIFWQ